MIESTLSAIFRSEESGERAYKTWSLRFAVESLASSTIATFEMIMICLQVRQMLKSKTAISLHHTPGVGARTPAKLIGGKLINRP